MTCARATFITPALVLLLFAGCHKASERAHEGRSPETANVASSRDVVNITAGSISISRGGQAAAPVSVAIRQGFHVNANPATFPYLIATDVKPGLADGLTINQPVYPAGQKKKFQFAAEPIAVYEGQTVIELPLQASSNATTGVRTLPLTVRVQACDDEKCLPPDTLQLQATVEVK